MNNKMVEQVLKEFKDELLRFVKRHIKDQDEAKEIHQEILIRIFTKFETLQRTESVKAWIYQIARNAIHDYYRKSSQKREALPADLADQEYRPTQEDSLLPCIQPFLQQLKPAYRDALRYTDLGQHSQKELAGHLNMSYSGAKSTVQRARKQLRELFDACCRIGVDQYGTVLSVEKKDSCFCSPVSPC